MKLLFRKDMVLLKEVYFKQKSSLYSVIFIIFLYRFVFTANGFSKLSVLTFLLTVMTSYSIFYNQPEQSKVFLSSLPIERWKVVSQPLVLSLLSLCLSAVFISVLFLVMKRDAETMNWLKEYMASFVMMSVYIGTYFVLVFQLPKRWVSGLVSVLTPMVIIWMKNLSDWRYETLTVSCLISLCYLGTSYIVAYYTIRE